MALNVTKIKRQFVITKGGKKQTLSDPGAHFSPEEVMKYYSGTHPELTTATIDGPKIEKGVAIYTAKTVAGTKG